MKTKAQQQEQWLEAKMGIREDLEKAVMLTWRAVGYSVRHFVRLTHVEDAALEALSYFFFEEMMK